MKKDDQRYLDIMSAYKFARLDNDKQEESSKLLQAAFDLRDKGEVSEDAIIAARYM